MDRLEYISKQRDETELMQDHERIKLILDSQYYKDQLDTVKLELAHKTKSLDELRNIRQMYED